MKSAKPVFIPSESRLTMQKGIRPVFFAVFTILFCSAVSPVCAATYYVDDVNGLDSRTPVQAQSIDTPWKTIGHAAQTVSAGSTVYIRGGTYYITGSITPANSGSAGNPITYSNYQGEEVIIDGGGGAYNGITINSNRSYLRFIGLIIQHCGTYDSAGNGMNIGIQSHHIEVLNCTIRNISKSSIKMDSCHDLILAGTDVSTSRYGFEVTPAGSANVYNVQFIDCSGHDMNPLWLEANPYGMADAFVIKTGSGRYCTDIYFAGCEAYNLWDDGFDVFSGGNIVLEHCVAHDIDSSVQINQPGKKYDEDGHGFKTYSMDTYIAPGQYHTQYIRCLAYDTNREGFKLSSLPEGSSTYHAKTQMLNCTAADTDYGILVVTAAGNEMELEIKNCLASTINRDPEDPCDGDDLSRALHIEDTPVIWFDWDPYFWPDFNYNLWHSRDYNDTVIECIDFLGELFSSAEVNNGTYYAQTGVDQNSISADPCFVDADSNDFTLSANSPCIDAGTDVNLPYAGSAPDIGVYESGMVEVNCPANYLTTGENWISVPVMPFNDGPYSVFKDLGKWPNSVYHNLYRYNSPTASTIEYPTYQSDSIQFGKIIPGHAYKLMLGGNQTSLKVSGIELSGTQTLTIGGSGTRYFYFGDPFNKTIYKSYCRISYNGNEVSIDEAISNGWTGNFEHFNPVSKTWEAMGSTIEKWHAYRFIAYTTSGELKLVIDYTLAGDLNNDGDVDHDDLGTMGGNWLDSDCGNMPVGNLDSDCDVDFKDYAILAGNWLAGT